MSWFVLTGTGKIGARCIQNRSSLGAYCVNQKSNGVNLSTLSTTWSAAGPQAVQQQWHCCVTQPMLALLLHKAILAPGEGSVSNKSNRHSLTALGATVCVPRLVLGQVIQADRLWAHGQHKQIH